MRLNQINRTRWTRARAFFALFIFSVAASFLGSATAFAQGDGSAKMRAVPTFIGFDDVVQWSDVPEILAKGAQDSGREITDYAWASDLLFHKEVWQLQFRYKNIRVIDVDFPSKDGKSLERKRVWYLVYSVTNTGERLSAEVDSDVKADVSELLIDGKKVQIPSNNLPGVYRAKKIQYEPGDKEGAIQFVPRFIFAAADVKGRYLYERGADGFYFLPASESASSEEAVYYDEYLPLAMVKIAQREGRGSQQFVDSLRMPSRKILPGETVWGVATWTDVDPRIDKFTIYISGLTNALHWELPDELEDSRVGAGRDIARKVLKINFFAPGDEESRGKEIYNNLPGELDYSWIWLYNEPK